MTTVWKVPSKDYARQYAALWPELGPRIERVFSSDEPVLGRALSEFEDDFARWLDVKHVIGVNSGMDALELAFGQLRLEPGDEVVTSANTFFATVTAIVSAGGRPVLVDPDPRTMNLSIEGVRAVCGPRTRAVAPVHLYGRAAPTEIFEFCARRGIDVVEDAAQAHGARTSNGRRVGASGGIGCFSFHPSKNLGAFGDGGAIAINDDDRAAELRSRRHLGKVGEYETRFVARNAKLDTIQAVVLSVKLRTLDALNDRRRYLANRYRELLREVGDLALPDDPPGQQHVYHLFVVRSAFRDELRTHLERRGIKASIHYPIPPHLQPLEVDLGYRPGSLPIAEALAKTVLSLPISPELTDAEIEIVATEVRSFFDRGAAR